MTIQERLDNARYALIEAEKAVNELNWQAMLEREVEEDFTLSSVCQRTLRAMAKLRNHIDGAAVILGQDTVK